VSGQMRPGHRQFSTKRAKAAIERPLQTMTQTLHILAFPALKHDAIGRRRTSPTLQHRHFEEPEATRNLLLNKSRSFACAQDDRCMNG
jgi:hypothetical protein